MELIQVSRDNHYIIYRLLSSNKLLECEATMYLDTLDYVYSLDADHLQIKCSDDTKFLNELNRILP